MPRRHLLVAIAILILGFPVAFEERAFAAGPEDPAAPAISPPAVPALGCPTCDSCSDPLGACCCNPVCGPPGRFWADADYLLWWVKGDRLPPLLTTSPPGTPADQAGVLGAPGTSTLIGGGDVNDDPRSGVRFRLGYWLNCEQTCGIEVNYFLLEAKAFHSTIGSAGNPILARPFFNAATGQPDSELVAFPGMVTGSATVGAPSSALNGPEVLFRHNLCCDCCYRVDLLGGWRYLRFAEHLGVGEDLVSVLPPSSGIAPGTTILLNDQFDTTNEFNGGELGVDAEYRSGRLAFELLAKLAVGVNDQTVNINGSTVVNEPGVGTAVNTGGLLALGTNIGQYHRDRTVVIPEFDANLSYQVTSHLRARVGYTFLYWPEIFRPGEQIDTTVNSTFIPGSATPPTGAPRPAPILGRQDLWVQGINLGLELRF